MLKKNLRNAIWGKFRLQSNFARHIGTQESTVSRIINGKIPFSTQRREAWAKVLECKPEDLVD